MRPRHALPIALVVVLGSPPAGALEPPTAPAATDPWDVVNKIIALRNGGKLDEAVTLARGAFDAAGSDTDLRRTVAREGKDVAVKLLERDRGNPKRTEAAVSALCWALETMRTYQAKLMTTERDRLTIPSEVSRLETLAAGLAAPCLAKEPEPEPPEPPPPTSPPADPTPASEQREGPEPPPAPTPVRRTRPQIAIGSTLLITSAGLAAGFAGCFAARPAVTARIAELDAQATAAGRDLTDAELLEATAADARYTRLSNAGKALGVFAVVGVLAGVLALALPPRASRRVHARPTGTGVRFNF
jgi:hypothetical protein